MLAGTACNHVGCSLTWIDRLDRNPNLGVGGAERFNLLAANLQAGLVPLLD